MDAAGKDGAIRHVMSGVNAARLPSLSVSNIQVPPNCNTTFFGAPPAIFAGRGRMASSNRSYYEESADRRVHRDSRSEHP